MTSVNKAIIIGNAGKDPEVKALANGNQVASFSVVTSDKWKDKATGEWKENTQWHNVVIFNEHLVKMAENHIRKGSKVYVEGAIKTRTWTDTAGVTRYSTEIVLQWFGGHIAILDFKNGGGEAPTSHQQAKQNGYQKQIDLDDEVPF